MTLSLNKDQVHTLFLVSLLLKSGISLFIIYKNIRCFIVQLPGTMNSHPSFSSPPDNSNNEYDDCVGSHDRREMHESVTSILSSFQVSFNSIEASNEDLAYFLESITVSDQNEVEQLYHPTRSQDAYRKGCEQDKILFDLNQLLESMAVPSALQNESKAGDSDDDNDTSSVMQDSIRLTKKRQSKCIILTDQDDHYHSPH
mmetsp:Transcript_31953/g.52748  ORF Transcript_31953/g.52748 Transcript_31953/m.52748 type:complete len:200 (-) Transcript_31953:34-633(-)